MHDGDGTGGGGRLPSPPVAGGRARPTEATPRHPELAMLLAEISALRSTLQSDLTMAAAALDAGAHDVAAHLVDHDLDEVARFQLTARARLQALDSADAAVDPAAQAAGSVDPAERLTAAPSLAGRTRPDTVAEPGTLVAVGGPAGSSRAPARSRAFRRMLPGAPLLAAAAALIGLFVGVVPDRTPSGGQTSGLSAAAAASWELETLASRRASTAELVAAAEDLNVQIARMVADSGGSPATAQQALLLLQRSTVILSASGPSSALDRVLAQARELEATLRESLPEQVQRALPPVGSSIPSRLPLAPRPRPTRATPRPATVPSPAAPAPTAAPSPSVAPSTAPSQAPPSSAPRATPSPSSSFGPLLPGFVPESQPRSGR